MNILQATREYEAWLGAHLRLLKADLNLKHAKMAADPSSFLRATFYRWAQLYPTLCKDVSNAPTVLSVGDLHLENYGTWRDAEGRLVWGINDFDEAFPLPYTNDLVRLAASACIAIETGDVSLSPARACAAILDGYTKGVENGGRPFILSERNRSLRAVVTSRLRDPTQFWEKLAAFPTVRRVPHSVMALLNCAMPERGIDFRVAHRQSGLGSLGRERFMGVAEWCGGKIAREAKALLPSACAWAGTGSGEANEIYYPEILRRSVRAADPFVAVHGGWVMRRLSPYCCRIELCQLPPGREEDRLLQAMGRELANIHLGSRRSIVAIRRDLRRRPSKWLREAARVMTGATLQEWKEWRKSRR